MSNRKYAFWTNDVESTSIWMNTLRDKTAHKVYKEGMPPLLDLYDKYNIKTTFFFTAYIAKLIPEIVRMAAERGHEVGSHGKSHLKENGFDIMPFKKQKQHLGDSKMLLEDISGQEVISFRAPALRVSKNTARALLDTGYLIDSSVASQRFDFFLSFGSNNKLRWLFAPRNIYTTKEDDIFKRGKGPLVEIPLSALILPYIGTTMRIFPWLTSIQRSFVHFEALAYNKPLVFDIHPNEFIDEKDEERIISRRAKSRINYFLQDWLRSQLKVKNLGMSALKLYENQIEFFNNRHYNFISIKDYCTKTGLI